MYRKTSIALLMVCLLMLAILPAQANDDPFEGDKSSPLYFAVGDIIKFGMIEQDGNKRNGREPIEWKVLAREENKALLISLYALEVLPYNQTMIDVTWETCTLRYWLNHPFMDLAFSSAERDAILITTVDNSADQGVCNTNSGQNTRDQVFLLSAHEAFDLYFSDNESRRCTATEYAYETVSAHTVRAYNGGCSWWLRSPGIKQIQASSVKSDGDIYSANYVSDSIYCVRPAMWVDVENDVF